MPYVVKFGTLGYYSKNQPHYDWSFTNDIEKANLYETLEGAEERRDFGLRIRESVLKKPVPTEGVVLEVERTIVVKKQISYENKKTIKNKPIREPQEKFIKEKKTSDIEKYHSLLLQSKDLLLDVDSQENDDTVTVTATYKTNKTVVKKFKIETGEEIK